MTVLCDGALSRPQVSSMIDRVRERIKALEADETSAAKREALEASANPYVDGGGRPEGVTRLPLAALTGAGNEWDGVGVGGARDDDVASQAADKVLSEGGRAAQVHSSRSLAAVAKRSEASVSVAMVAITEEPSHGVGPLVVRHTDDQGARLEAKNHVSNLPYMHRNPAV